MRRHIIKGYNQFLEAHFGEGLVLPPDLVSKGPGKKKTARRKDADEPTKGKIKYNRKGIQTRCSNCGVLGHSKKTCKSSPQQQVI